jgi:hypothetical protein
MFDWFRRKEEPTREFADTASAFAHACTLRYQFLIDARVPALVMEEGRRGTEGEHWFLLHLAGPQGVLEVWGCTMAGAPAYPKSGDLVAFRIVRIATEMPEEASLIGYIECRLDPFLIGAHKWRVAETYVPDNLKPELHFF